MKNKIQKGKKLKKALKSFKIKCITDHNQAINQLKSLKKDFKR